MYSLFLKKLHPNGIMPCFTSMLNAFPMREKGELGIHCLGNRNAGFFGLFCYFLPKYSDVNSNPRRRDLIESTANFHFLSLICYYLLWFQPFLPLLRLFQAHTGLSLPSISGLFISPHASQSGLKREAHHGSRVDERCTNNYNIQKPVHCNFMF